MRIRTVKPEFWSHPVMGRACDYDKWVAVALLNLADDEGYFLADPDLVKAAVDPFGPSIVGPTVDVPLSSCRTTVGLPEASSGSTTGLIRVSEALKRLVLLGWIQLRNHETHGPIGWVVNFNKHQKVNNASASRYKHLWESCTPTVGLPEASYSPTLVLPPGTGNREQGTGNRDQVVARARERGVPTPNIPSGGDASRSNGKAGHLPATTESQEPKTATESEGGLPTSGTSSEKSPSKPKPRKRKPAATAAASAPADGDPVLLAGDILAKRWNEAGDFAAEIHDDGPVWPKVEKRGDGRWPYDSLWNRIKVILAACGGDLTNFDAEIRHGLRALVYDDKYWNVEEKSGTPTLHRALHENYWEERVLKGKAILAERKSEATKSYWFNKRQLEEYEEKLARFKPSDPRDSSEWLVNGIKEYKAEIAEYEKTYGVPEAKVAR